jgi:hypothetical protein
MPEEPEVVLDDIFVLCRAFEGTWSGTGKAREQAQEAIIETILAHRIGALPDVQTLVAKLRAFVTASAEEFKQWFGSEKRPPAEIKREVLNTIRTLQEAIASDRWTEHSSRKLGRLIYRMRCAVVHPSLDTQNSLALSVLPALRAALIELTIARSAVRYQLPLAEARRQFDAALV